MEGAHRRTLGSQAEQTYSMVYPTGTSNYTKQLHNIQQQYNNHTQKICLTKQFTNTVKHTRQTDPLTDKHKSYKDTTSHSPQIRS